MTRTLASIVVLSAGLTLAATPREYVADKLKDIKGKTKDAQKRLSDATDKLEEANKGVADARGKLKTTKEKMAKSQEGVDGAGAGLKAAIDANLKMAGLLKALPPATPGRAELITENDKQLTQLQGADAQLKSASAANAEAATALGEADGKLETAGGALAKAKLGPVSDQLDGVDSIVDQTAKVNKAAMPNFPDIKELK